MSSALATLTRAFWGICSFRLAPQDIPRSSALLATAVAANTILSVLIYQVKYSFSLSLMKVALEMLVLVGLTAAMLFSFNKGNRTVQTITAFMGTGALIGVFAFVLLLFMPVLSRWPILPKLLWNIVLVWNLSVVAHIIRHALDTIFVVGVFIAIGYAVFLFELDVLINGLIRTAAA